jgi:hypothetical protein
MSDRADTCLRTGGSRNHCRSLANPEAYRFRGDTLGIDIALAWIAPGMWGLLVLMTALLAAVDASRRWVGESPSWTGRNRKLLLVVVCCLPFQFLLLHYGPQHGSTDKIGRNMTICQWILFNAALMPWRVSEATEAVPAINSLQGT